MNIAIDMTDYIPGGANGGIVPLTVATIKNISRKPQYEITILARERNYAQLQYLKTNKIDIFNVDKKNIEGTDPVEKQELPDETPPPPPTIVTPKRKVYLKIRNICAAIVPEGIFLWVRQHRVEFGKVKFALLHPIKGICVPVGKKVLPHGLYKRIKERKIAKIEETFRAAEEARAAEIAESEKITSVEGQISLEKLTGKKIDVLYCPFTAINFVDPNVATVSVLNDIQHKFCPHFFTQEEIDTRDAFYQKIIELKPYIISISKYTKNTFLEMYDFPSERIIPIPCAVQNRLSEYKSDHDVEELKEFNLESKKFVLYPANFWPHKNHRGLLIAFEMFCARNPDVDLHLVLTGFSSDKNSLWVEATQRMGIADKVHYLGYVTDAQLAVLLRNCRFMVFPSLFEGFGMPITEAMAMGTTVICSNVTSLPEVGGDCVFYFNPYDPADICQQMEYVLKRPEEEEKKKEKYRAHLQQFSTDVYIDKICALFEEIA